MAARCLLNMLYFSNYMLGIHLPQRCLVFFFNVSPKVVSKGAGAAFLEFFQLLKSFQRFSAEPIGPVTQLYWATFQEIRQQFLRRGCQHTCVRERVKLEGWGVMWIDVKGVKAGKYTLKFTVSCQSKRGGKTEGQDLALSNLSTAGSCSRVREKWNWSNQLAKPVQHLALKAI